MNIKAPPYAESKTLNNKCAHFTVQIDVVDPMWSI